MLAVGIRNKRTQNRKNFGPCCTERRSGNIPSPSVEQAGVGLGVNLGRFGGVRSIYIGNGKNLGDFGIWGVQAIMVVFSWLLLAAAMRGLHPLIASALSAPILAVLMMDGVGDGLAHPHLPEPRIGAVTVRTARVVIAFPTAASTVLGDEPVIVVANEEKMVPEAILAASIARGRVAPGALVVVARVVAPLVASQHGHPAQQRTRA